MQALAKTSEARAKWLKERLLLAMDLMQTERIDGPRFRVTIARSGGKAPVVVHCPVEELPVGLVRTTVKREPDKGAIREALESGADVPGCELGERSRTVRLK